MLVAAGDLQGGDRRDGRLQAGTECCRRRLMSGRPSQTGKPDVRDVKAESRLSCCDRAARDPGGDEQASAAVEDAMRNPGEVMKLVISPSD
jgi:hypothetical protein